MRRVRRVRGRKGGKGWKNTTWAAESRIVFSRALYALTFLMWLLMMRARCFLSNMTLKRSTVEEGFRYVSVQISNLSEPQPLNAHSRSFHCGAWRSVSSLPKLILPTFPSHQIGQSIS